MCPACFTIAVQNSDASLPSLDSSRCRVRRLLRYYQDVTTSCCSSRFASFPSLRNTMSTCDVLTFCASSHAKRSPGVYTDSSRYLTWKQQDLPSSRESSIVRLLLFSDPGRTSFSDHCEKSVLLPLARRRKLQRSWYFGAL